MLPDSPSYYSPPPWPSSVVFLSQSVFPCWNDSAADYQTQIALIAGTNWKESIPGAECICLPVQKLASVAYLTSSGKEAKKPLCLRTLSSALNHTLGRLFSDEATEQAGGVWQNTPPPQQERPQGKSSMKTDGNSAEQLMHFFIWLGQDLRDYETLVEEEAERQRGLCYCCFHHFAQLLTEFCGLALIEEQHLAYWAFSRLSLRATRFLDNATFDWTSGFQTVSAFANNKQEITKWHFLGKQKATQASFCSDWAIYHSTVESSVPNEVKDFLPVPCSLPDTAGKCYKSQWSDNLWLNMFWATYSLKKGNGVKTSSALQRHYLWYVLSLLNQLLSPCRDPCSFIFMPNTIIRKEQLGMGFMLCNVIIFNT